MDAELTNICDLLIRNYDDIKNTDAKVDIEYHLAGAAMYMAEGMSTDMEELEHCGYINQEKSEKLADYRSKVEFFIRCKMSLYEDPEEYFDLLMEVCKYLQTGKMFTETNNILSGMLLIDGLAVSDTDQYAEQAGEITDIFFEMNNGDKHAHTEKPYAVICSLYGKDPSEVVDRELEIRDVIKKAVKMDTVSQKAVSRCLALHDGDTYSECDRMINVATGLKKAKHSVGQGRVNIILALATGLDISEEDLIVNIIEADEYLKQHKPFKGLMGVEPEIRRLFAILCVVTRFEDPDGGFARFSVLMAIYVLILNATRTF